jgi:predicted secreted protein
MAELINTKVGKAFEIPLQATPTAGFRWELLFPTGPVDLVDFVGTEWQQVQPGVIGGSATQGFRFNAVAPGELTLVFEYRRPWEATKRRRRAIQVRIAPPGASPGKHDDRRADAARGRMITGSREPRPLPPAPPAG